MIDRTALWSLKREEKGKKNGRDKPNVAFSPWLAFQSPKFRNIVFPSMKILACSLEIRIF